MGGPRRLRRRLFLSLLRAAAARAACRLPPYRAAHVINVPTIFPSFPGAQRKGPLAMKRNICSPKAVALLLFLLDTAGRGSGPPSVEIGLRAPFYRGMNLSFQRYLKKKKENSRNKATYITLRGIRPSIHPTMAVSSSRSVHRRTLFGETPGSELRTQTKQQNQFRRPKAVPRKSAKPCVAQLRKKKEGFLKTFYYPARHVGWSHCGQ